MNVGTGFSVEVDRANGQLADQFTDNYRRRFVQLSVTASSLD